MFGKKIKDKAAEKTKTTLSGMKSGIKDSPNKMKYMKNLRNVENQKKTFQSNITSLKNCCEQIEKMKQNYNGSPLYYGRQLWSLLNLETWFRIYIDEEEL